MNSEELPTALEKGNARLQRLFEVIEAKISAGDPTVETDLMRYAALSDQFNAKIETTEIELFKEKFALDIIDGRLKEARECFIKLMRLNPEDPGHKFRKLMLQRLGIDINSE